MDKPNSIWDLTVAPWTNAPRFYPPGQHPAVAQDREVLRKLEALGQGDHEMASYLRQRLADFEQVESDIKARYDRWLAEYRED